VGRAGEFFAAYKLQMAGVEVHHHDAAFDLIAILPSGKMLRVEVKTASAPKHSGTYGFMIGGSRADLFVFAALDVGLVRVLRPCSIGEKRMIYFPVSEFSTENEAADLAAILQEDGQ
jgi:hypothetical protein